MSISYHVFGLHLGLEAQVLGLHLDLGYVSMTPTLAINM